MGLANHLDKIQRDDILELANRAFREGNPLYPVPKVLTRAELAQILIKVKGEEG